jgi:hypothetical protein
MTLDIGGRGATAIGAGRTEALVAVAVHGGSDDGFPAEADAFLYGNGWQFHRALQCGLGTNFVVAG